MSFTYVGIPYSSSNPDPVQAAAERAERMERFWEACGYLIERGEHIVSPMTLEPALVRAPHLPYDWKFWQHYSRHMLALCNKLVVLKLEGWTTSTGVQGEIAEAALYGIEVEFLEVATVTNWLEQKATL